VYPVKQSTALTLPFFVHDANGDAVTALTDGSFTKRISKNGAAFGAMTVTITEMENGWYSIPLSTSHSDTLGLLTIVFTNAGAKQVNLQVRVHARLPDDMAFPTVAGRSIDVTATGAAGIDWGNVENPTTAVDLSATDIQLADTVTTLTGHTVQTGDSFARLGAPAGASVSADIADLPTVAEFDARTLVAASYFDPAADTVANVTTVATLTGHTAQTGDSFARLGAPAGVSVSADIADLPTVAEFNARTLVAASYFDPAADTVANVTTVATCTANTDMRGTDNAALASVVTMAAINAEVLDVLNTDTFALPGQIAPPLAPTIVNAITWLYKTLRNRKDQNANLWQLYADDETTVDAKATVSDDGTTAVKQEIVTGP
jgi:hypothetical protein